MMCAYLVAGVVACHHDAAQGEAEAHDSVAPGTMLLCRALANQQRVFGNLWASPSFPRWLAWMLRLDLPKLRQEDYETQQRIRQSEAQWLEQPRLGARRLERQQLGAGCS